MQWAMCRLAKMKLPRITVVTRESSVTFGIKCAWLLTLFEYATIMVLAPISNHT